MNAYAIERAADLDALAEPRRERTVPLKLVQHTERHMHDEAMASAAWSGYGRPGFTTADAGGAAVVPGWVQRAQSGTLPAKVLR